MRQGSAQPNCWRAKQWPWEFPPGYRWGYWTGHNSVRAAGYYPGPRDRMAIAAGAAVEPYFHVMNFAIPGRDTITTQVVPEGDMAIVAITGNTDLSPDDANAFPGSRIRFYQKTGKETGFNVNDKPTNIANLLGTGRLPLVLRKPYYPPAEEPILGRVVSAATGSQNVQIVLVGLRRRLS